MLLYEMQQLLLRRQFLNGFSGFKSETRQCRKAVQISRGPLLGNAYLLGKIHRLSRSPVEVGSGCPTSIMGQGEERVGAKAAKQFPGVERVPPANAINRDRRTVAAAAERPDWKGTSGSGCGVVSSGAAAWQSVLSKSGSSERWRWFRRRFLPAASA